MLLPKNTKGPEYYYPEPYDLVGVEAQASIMDAFYILLLLLAALNDRGNSLS